MVLYYMPYIIIFTLYLYINATLLVNHCIVCTSHYCFLVGLCIAPYVKVPPFVVKFVLSTHVVVFPVILYRDNVFISMWLDLQKGIFTCIQLCNLVRCIRNLCCGGPAKLKFVPIMQKFHITKFYGYSSTTHFIKVGNVSVHNYDLITHISYIF